MLLIGTICKLRRLVYETVRLLYFKEAVDFLPGEG